MKKTLIFSGLMLAAAFTLTNCVKETVNPAADAQKGVPFSINVGIDTKTVTLDGSIISWADGDQLNVFHAEAGSTTYGSNDPFTYAAAPTSASQFDGELQDGPLTADAYDWYVLYPYDSHIKTPGEKSSGYTTIYSNQKQDGYGNKEHLAGYGVPLYGKATNVAKDDKPSITLKQLCSVVKINITNTTDAPVQISSVAFTAPENITGNFFVDFTGATAAIAEKSGSVGKTATLSVSGEETIAISGKASFYIAIKPFTASSGTLSVVMNDVCTKTFVLTKEVSFPEGEVSVINVNYTGKDVVAAKTLPYENTLISGHEDFTINNVKTGSLDAIWTDSSYGITANANKTTSDVEAYLVSPVFDLTGEAAAFLYFSHNVRYFADLATAKEQATLEVKAGDADWTAVEIPNYSSNSDNSFVATSVNLTSFCGKMVQVRFKFLATSVNPGRWEIKNFSLKSEVEKSLAVSPTSLNWAADATDEKEVTVTLNDGASGYTVTPPTDGNWNISKDGNTIKVSPKAANISTADAKTITLTIAHADDGNLTKTVTCTQAKASSGSEVSYTLTFPDGNSSNNGLKSNQYTSTWTATSGTTSWSISNFNNNNWNNNWAYIKCGRKNNASVATIITDAALSEAIKTVTITIDAVTVDKINSIRLYSSSDGSSWTEEGSFTIEIGDKEVNISSPAANKFYKLEFDCASGSSNGLLTLSKVVYSNN